MPAAAPPRPPSRGRHSSHPASGHNLSFTGDYVNVLKPRGDVGLGIKSGEPAPRKGSPGTAQRRRDVAVTLDAEAQQIFPKAGEEIGRAVISLQVMLEASSNHRRGHTRATEYTQKFYESQVRYVSQGALNL